jgi:hypothetical protein
MRFRMAADRSLKSRSTTYLRFVVDVVMRRRDGTAQVSKFHVLLFHPLLDQFFSVNTTPIVNRIIGAYLCTAGPLGDLDRAKPRTGDRTPD